MDIAVAKCFEQGKQKHTNKVEPKFHKGDWVVVSTTKGDRVVQIASVEYFKDCYPSYITTEGRWFGNGTKARLLTDKDIEITTIPESKIIIKKVEPKFKIGDWIADGYNKIRIVAVEDDVYKYSDNYILGDIKSIDERYHLWTIQDAKDGDVLCYKNEISLYKHDIKNYTKKEKTFGGFVYYCCYDGKRLIINSLYSLTEQDKMDIHPATKKQRDLLFSKMKEAGYEWDAEKKELNKIEQTIEIPFGSKDSELQEITYYIPKCFYAEIDDDKVVIKKGEKPTTWSEEDEMFVHGLIRGLAAKRDIHGHTTFSSDCIDITETINWLNSIKGRVQTKQEWTMQDEEELQIALDTLVKAGQHSSAEWLKDVCLVPQNHWKPSGKQMEVLKETMNIAGCKYKSCLNSLYSDLKKLKD